MVRAKSGSDVLGVRAIRAGREADKIDEENGNDLALFALRIAGA
jgi:hypothetical protein